MSQISNIYEVKIPKKLSAILGLDRAEGGGLRAEGGGRCPHQPTKNILSSLY